MPHKFRGFTIIELMVTVAIAAILLTLAAPSFNTFVRDMRVATIASDLRSDLILARGEALRRNTGVSICPSSSGAACGGSWENGWIVVTAPGGVVIKTRSALPAGYTMSGGGAIVLAAAGQAAAASTLLICKDAGAAGRTVSIMLSGLSRTTKTTC